MIHCKPSFPADTLALLQAELTRAAVGPGEALAGPVLWPRFAGYYQALTRLPRKARRALQRQWRRARSAGSRSSWPSARPRRSRRPSTSMG